MPTGGELRARRDNGPRDDFRQARPDHATKWDIAHIRDDLSGVFTVISIANGLLATAILVAMV